MAPLSHSQSSHTRLYPCKVENMPRLFFIRTSQCKMSFGLCAGVAQCSVVFPCSEEHPLPGVLRRKGQPPGHGHWWLGTEAAPRLHFHHSCLVLAVAMAPVHQPEGTGEILVQADPSLCLALAVTVPGRLPLCCTPSFPGGDGAEGFEAKGLQRFVYLGRLIRAEGNRGSSLCDISGDSW